MAKYKDMTYTERTDGRLMKKVSVKGRNKPIYLYSDNPEDLRNQYIELKYNDLNNSITDGTVTLKQWGEKWFQIHISMKEYNTQSKIRNLLDNHIYPELGKIKLKDLKVFHIREFQNKMIEKGLTETCNRSISTVKRILNDAIENDIIQKNVAFNVKSVKFTRIEKEPLSVNEDKLLLEVAKKHKYGLFFMVLRYTGLRREEIVPLSIDDIDLNNKKISINKAVYFKNNKPYIKSTKNRKNRKVPILDIIYEPLKERIEFCKQNKQKLLFTKQTDNKMLSITAIRCMLRSFLYAMNKQSDKEISFTLHQLRHSYCTMLYYSGIDIKKAEELMGHSSADMVYNIYAHLDEEREHAEENLNKYLNSIYKKTLKLSKKLSNSKYKSSKPLKSLLYIE